MTHDVTIDDDGINAALGELAGSGQSAPLTGQMMPPPGDEPPPESTPSEYVMLSKMLAGIIANRVCPNWEVPGDTQTEWAEALAECLNELFPGGLGNIENWGPWAKLAFASGSFAMCGIDMTTMSLKPLHPVDDEEEAGQPPPPPPQQNQFTTAGEPKTSSGNFTTEEG